MKNKEESTNNQSLLGKSDMYIAANVLATMTLKNMLHNGEKLPTVEELIAKGCTLPPEQLQEMLDRAEKLYQIDLKYSSNLLEPPSEPDLFADGLGI